MHIEFTTYGWEDFSYWLENDMDTVVKIKALIGSIKQPFKGLDKPEPLKYGLKGFWSRRITTEHRLVYQISGKRGVDQNCTIIQCRFHYEG